MEVEKQTVKKRYKVRGFDGGNITGTNTLFIGWLDEVRSFKNTINYVRYNWSLVAKILDVHRGEPEVSSHIQQNVLENQQINLNFTF